MSDLRQKNHERVWKIRQAEANDAFDFRWGTDELDHAATCLFAQRGEAPCSRTYDPYPEGRDSAPADPTLYADTGIGYLYGDDESGRFAWEFAGWTLQKDGSL